MGVLGVKYSHQNGQILQGENKKKMPRRIFFQV
jgi:hypothetical protein